MKVKDASPESAWTKFKNNIAKIGTTESPFPHLITQARISEETGRRAILELNLAQPLTHGRAVTFFAEKMGFTENQVDNAIEEDSIFAGDNWEERRQACADYIVNNISDWEQ